MSQTHYENCRKLFQSFTSVNHVHVHISVVRQNENKDSDESLLTPNEASLWDIFVARHCSFDMNFWLSKPAPLTNHFPVTPLDTKRPPPVREITIRATAILDVQILRAKVLHYFRHVAPEVKSQAGDNSEFSPPLSLLNMHSSYSALSRIETSLYNALEIPTLLGILRETSLTLSSLVLHQSPVSEREGSLYTEADDNEIDLPRLRLFKIPVNPLSRHLLSRLSAPSLRYFNMGIGSDSPTSFLCPSKHKMEPLRFLDTAPSLSSVRVDYSYTDAHGKESAQILTHLKDEFSDSIDYDINLFFMDSSWIDAMENPNIRKCLLPLLTNVVSLRSDLRTATLPDKRQSCVYILPRLYTCSLPSRLYDGSVYYLQHFLDTVKFPCLRRFHMDISLKVHNAFDMHGPTTIESAMSLTLNHFRIQHPKWTCLEKLDYRLFHVPKQNLVKIRRDFLDLREACDAHGAQVEWIIQPLSMRDWSDLEPESDSEPELESGTSWSLSLRQNLRESMMRSWSLSQSLSLSQIQSRAYRIPLS